MKTHEQIIAEFREKIKHIPELEDGYIRDNLESFILDVLKERDEDIREIIEQMKKLITIETYPWTGDMGWNAALDELLTKLNKI